MYIDCLCIIKRTITLIIAEKKHHTEIKYAIINILVITHDNKMIIPSSCIFLTLEIKVETTVGIIYNKLISYKRCDVGGKSRVYLM